MKTKTTNLPPLIKTVRVPLSPHAAFERFTEGISSWWPLATHSIGLKDAETVIMEGEVGGRFYERQRDGSTCDWGQVTVWDPPSRVAFTWYPDRTPDTAQNVEVCFRAVENGTEVELTHRDWETFGDRAAEKRDNYSTGWAGVLERYVHV